MDFDEIFSCRFNSGVDCRWQCGCDECGWNPSVAEKRKKELKDTGHIVAVSSEEFMSDEDVAAEFRKRMKMFNGTESRHFVQTDMHVGPHRASQIIYRMKRGEL